MYDRVLLELEQLLPALDNVMDAIQETGPYWLESEVQYLAEQIEGLIEEIWDASEKDPTNAT